MRTIKSSFIEQVIERCFKKYVFRNIFKNLQESSGAVLFFCYYIFFWKKCFRLWAYKFIKKDWSSNLLSCELFKVYENTFFQEYPVTLTLHICIVVEILCLTRDKVASLALVGHPSSDRLT